MGLCLMGPTGQIVYLNRKSVSISILRPARLIVDICCSPHWNCEKSHMRKSLKRAVVLLLFLATCSVVYASAAGLPFIQDDYGAALRQAKARNLPIFVECWAPW